MAWLTPTSGSFNELTETEFRELVVELCWAINERRELLGQSTTTWIYLDTDYPVIGDMVNIRFHGLDGIVGGNCGLYSEVYVLWNVIMLEAIELWDASEIEGWCRSATNRATWTQTGEERAIAYANSYNIVGLDTIVDVFRVAYDGPVAIADAMRYNPRSPYPWRVIKDMLDDMKWPKWHEPAGTATHDEGQWDGVLLESAWDGAIAQLHETAASAAGLVVWNMYGNPLHYRAFVAHNGRIELDISHITGIILESCVTVNYSSFGEQDTTTVVTCTDGWGNDYAISGDGSGSTDLSFGSFIDTLTLTTEIPEDCPFSVWEEDNGELCAYRIADIVAGNVYTAFVVGTDLTYG